MSGAAGVEDVYSAIEESARLLDVGCSRDDVVPILTAYEGALADAVIVLSMANGDHGGELDYSITVSTDHGDPYARALSEGLVEETDHPVGSLLSDLRANCPIGGYAIDCGVVGGFKKTYSFFPTDDLQRPSTLAGIPSMPPGLAENVELLARHGLDDKVSMISIDYRKRTVNLYFGKLHADCLEPKAVLWLLSDLGLPEPSDETLEFVQKSFAIYATFGWDSPKIERITYAVITQDPVALPARIEPELEKFARNAMYSYADQGKRTLVYGITWSPDEEYYKLGSYYQINARTRKLLVAFDAIKD